MTGLRRFLPRYTLRTLAIFLLLYTSSSGLWWNWAAWVPGPSTRTSPGVCHAEFSADGSRVVIERVLDVFPSPGEVANKFTSVMTERSVWKTTTGKCEQLDEVAYVPREETELIEDESPDGKRTFSYWCHLNRPSTVVGREDGVLEVRDIARNKRLAVLGKCRAIMSIRFCEGATRALSIDEAGQVRTWRRRRPEWWWGVFYLREFWATAFFAAFFAWSVRGDRRYFKTLDERLAASLAARAAAKAQRGPEGPAPR